MKNFSAFDIIGPIMIGPSSSHTAGAARLGKIAGVIAGENIKSVTFILHGSFAQTYKGHGTDRALVAGILGMEPWDTNLRDSISIAKTKGIEVAFEQGDLGDVHPNTVKFIITKKDGKTVKVVGSSVGGGNITISEVDGETVEFDGAYPTLIINHRDVPGMISRVSTLIYEANINIAFLKVYRSSRGSSATMVLETDTKVSESIIDNMKYIIGIDSIKVINPILEGE